jgi:hypothetical protein
VKIKDSLEDFLMGIDVKVVSADDLGQNGDDAIVAEHGTENSEFCLAVLRGQSIIGEAAI